MMMFLHSLVLASQMSQVAAAAQTPQSIAYTADAGGARTTIGNNGSVAASEHAVPVNLIRGGSVRVCRGTTVHFAKDASTAGRSEGDQAGLMMSLDRGAFEAKYTPGPYSDVILTPDLRILVSGPGAVDLRLSVNAHGDTCLANPGDGAPYVTVTSLMDSGVYRVQPGQKVMFADGSLDRVEDRTPENCGCPDEDTAPLQAAGKTPGAATTAEKNPFPADVSAGLVAPPASANAAPAGEVHAQVSATLSSDQPLGPPPPLEPAKPVAKAAAPPQTPEPEKPHRGFLSGLGHFFSKVFGAD